MKVLVLSDSHASLSFMRMCIDAVAPNIVLHLGDYYDNGAAMADEYPDIRFYLVPGNCDRYRVEPETPLILVPVLGGVPVYMTHGHLHGVKMTYVRLIQDARAAGAKAALFGHTHEAYCAREEDGLWVMNPGSCGYHGGSAGLLVIHNKEITECRILYQRDLEALK